MAQPFKHPKSGVFYIRRKVPEELQGVLGREYKRSLKTREPSEAKRAFAVAFEMSEQVFARARAQRGGVQLLNAKDLQILAGRWFERVLAEAEASGNFEGLLAQGETTIWEQGGHTESYTPMVPLAQVIDEISPEYVAAVVVRHARDALRREGIPYPSEGTQQERELLEAFRQHWLTLSGLAAQRAAGDWASKVATIGQERLSLDVPKAPQASFRGLLEAFQGYADERFLNDGKSREVLKSVDGYKSVMEEFIELMGDLPLTEIKREVVSKYRAQLVQLPKGGAGGRSLTAPQKIAKAVELGLPTINNATVRNKVQALSSVLSYALRMQYINENPVIGSGVGRAVTRAASRTATEKRARNHFDAAELKAIFSSPAFSDPTWNWPSADYGRAWYWVPLLMYYTGARREEVAQLAVRDVLLEDGGVPHLNILNSETGDDAGRTVKTAGSRRLIPLHKDMERLGFFDYVRSLPAGGQLFPKLKPSPSGYFATNFGKRWGQYLRDVVKLESPANPAHGFRHTFKTLCRSVGIPEDVGDAITGHAGHSRVARSYGEMPLSRMAAELEKFPSAPLAALRVQS